MASVAWDLTRECGATKPTAPREGSVQSGITRKRFVSGVAAAAGLTALTPRRGVAARPLVLKFGVDLASDHPTTVGARAAGKQIETETDGRIRVQVFPSSQLGNDTNMLSELRSGAMQMMGIGDNILATLVPNAAIDNIGFAFKNGQTAWNTLDGTVGDMVRADIMKVGLHPMHRIWDEGFRQITSSTKQIETPADLAGFKIRVPPSPISVDLFRALGASPVTLNIAELYTALQTHVVDGQENPLGNIYTQKFFQVQKYCSMTNHMWVGYWILMNGTTWSGMAPADQKIVEAAFNAQALVQRQANEKLDNSLEAKLKQLGMQFYQPDLTLFRTALAKSNFYKEWKAKFGPQLWGALEKATGPLG
jgi:tripartite ATP-independent transporter DctP family solute receptor